MKTFIDFLKLIPRPMQIAFAGIVLGVGLAAAHEVRYMTVADFTKSYILDLKATIRDLQRELRNGVLEPRLQDMIEEEIAGYMDELCYEQPKDPYCVPEPPE